MVSSTMTVTGESDKEIKSMAFTPCSFLLLFRKYFFMTASVNGKLSTATEAIVHDNITGIFTYTRIGYICVGCGTLTVTNDIGAYSAIVSNLPQTYTGNPYPGAFVAEDNTYNDFYINGSAIVNRKPVSKGHTLRLSCIYMCQ